MNGLKKILDKRLAGVLCFLFAVANRLVYTTLNSLIGTDTKIQLTYTQNLLSGKGIGVTKYFTTDLAAPVYDAQQLFPPGFSLAIIPFLKLSDNNEHTAVLIFDMLAAVLFVIAIRLLAKKAALPCWLVNIITLVAGCSQYIFFNSWSSTDAISLSLVLFGTGEMMNVINKQQNISWLRMMGSGFLFALPFFFRYMYLPVAFLLPLFVLLTGFFYKNSGLKAAGTKLLTGTATWLLLFFSFSYFTSDNALFVQDFGRGVFFHQLMNWYPFLPASFINLDFGAQLVEKLSRFSYIQVIQFCKYLNAVLFIVLLILFFRYLFLQKNKLSLPGFSVLIITGSFISLCILLLLAWLTLTYKALSWGYQQWTHAQDARYFAYIYAMMPLLFFTCLYHYRSSFKKLIPRFFAILLLLSLATEVLHGIYYNIKIISLHQDLSIVRDADRGYRNFSTVIDRIKTHYPGSEILVSSPDQYYLHAASQMGYKAVFDYEKLATSELSVHTNSVLLIPVHQQEAVIIKDYVEKKKPVLFTEIAGTYFYIKEINPRK